MTEPSLRLRAIALLGELVEQGTVIRCRLGDVEGADLDDTLVYDGRSIASVEQALREAEERGAAQANAVQMSGDADLSAMALGFGNVLRQACGSRVGFCLLLVTRTGARAYAGTTPRGLAVRLMRLQADDWVNEQRAADAGPPAVHVLHEGRTLCGQFQGLVPIQWPEGHKWVRADEPERVTCPTCRKTLELASKLEIA